MQIEQFAYNIITNPEQLGATSKRPRTNNHEIFFAEMKRLTNPEIAHICFNIETNQSARFSQQSYQQIRRDLGISGNLNSGKILAATTGTFYAKFDQLAITGLALWVKTRRGAADVCYVIAVHQLVDVPEYHELVCYELTADANGTLEDYRGGKMRFAGSEVIQGIDARYLREAEIQLPHMLRRLEKWADNGSGELIALAITLMQSNGVRRGAKLHRNRVNNERMPVFYNESGRRYDPKEFVTKYVGSVEEAVFGGGVANDDREAWPQDILADQNIVRLPFPRRVDQDRACTPRHRHRVGGHWRHYRSGKVIWIAPHERGSLNLMKIYSVRGDIAV